MSKLNKLYVTFALLGGLSGWGSLEAQTDAPVLIPFQGHLARPDAAGAYAPVEDGQYDVLYTLYLAPVGGESKVWGPERHENIVIVNGLVNALLGTVIGFEDALAANPQFFARPLYVGVTIDADGNPATADLELSPRQVLLPSHQSHNSNHLDGADWRRFFVGTDANATYEAGVTKARDADALDGFDWRDVFDNGDPSSGKIVGSKIADATVATANIAPQSITRELVAPGALTSDALSPEFQLKVENPAGAIMAFGGAEVPDGWLLCDGRIVEVDEYPDLFDAIGSAWGAGLPEREDDFHLPDLRAMFLRGVHGEKPGPGYVDPDRDGRVAAAPGGNVGNAVGSVQGEQFKRHTHTRPHTTTPYWNSDAAFNSGEGRRRSSGRSDYNTGPAGGSETRPINAYVHYIIKY